MLMQKNAIRSRTKRTRRKQSKFLTPDLALFQGKLLHFVAGPDDPLSEAERVRGEFAEMVEDQHAAVRQFLQRAYFVADRFRRRPRDFERFQVHWFWKQTRQKPKDPSTSKWILLFLMQATTTRMRHRAGKYAVLLDGLTQDQVEISAVAARIQELGGVDAAYEAMRARKRGDAQVSGTVAVAQTAVAGRRTRRDDEHSSCEMGASVMPATKPAPRSRPQPTFPLYPLVAPPSAEEKMQPYDDGDENKTVWGESVCGFIQRLARKYAEIEDGDQQAVSRVLQCAYLAMREMQRQPDQFKRLKADRFWKAPWRRPKDASISKWLMFFIVQATSPGVRHLAGTYAEILEGLQRDQVEIRAVAARIEELGGIEAAYQVMRARTTQDSPNKRATPMAWKSQQPARPTTRTAQPTDVDGQLFFDATAGERGAYYIIGPSGEKIRLNPAKPPRPPRKLNDFDRWGKRISQCQAQLPQARTKEERDHLNMEIRVLEHLIEEGRAKILDRRLAARTKRRLGWKSISGPR
jgi:hypothetical protein